MVRWPLGLDDLDEEVDTLLIGLVVHVECWPNCKHVCVPSLSGWRVFALFDVNAWNQWEAGHVSLMHFISQNALPFWLKIVSSENWLASALPLSYLIAMA